MSFLKQILLLLSELDIHSKTSIMSHWIHSAHRQFKTLGMDSRVVPIYGSIFVLKSPRVAYVNYRDLDIERINEDGILTSYEKASI